VALSHLLNEAELDDESILLVDRWRHGDQQAADELFQRYSQRLVRLACRHLSAQLAARVEAEDVVQSACNSFFTGARDGRFVLERSGDLWRLLVSITLHKVHDKIRRQTSQKRAVQREQRIDQLANGESIPVEVIARDPQPEDAATVADLLEQLLRRFEPNHRLALELRLQGHSLEEIAASTNLSHSTVRRVLRRARDHLVDWDRIEATQV
jgi:RNA polymerase sigma-70 factor (ECF subfamily)